MPGFRTPDLTALTAAGAANDDYFLIFDSSANTLKKILKSEVSAMAQTDLAASAVLTKLLTVDGPGSLLDADTLDGVQLAALAQLSGAAFTGNVSVGGSFTHSGAQATFNKVVVGELTGRVDYETYSGSRTMTLSDANLQLYIDNNNTVPSAVFAKGDNITVHSTNNSARVSRGSGLTMNFDGTNVTEVWIRQHRSAVIVFDSDTVCRVIGGTTTAPP